MSIEDFTVEEPGRGKRLTIDLTPAARAELLRLKGITGKDTAEYFKMNLVQTRKLIGLYERGARIYVALPDQALEELEKPY